MKLVPFGVIEILASTKVFTASPELGATPSVERVSVSPPTVRLTEACPVTCPAEFEVNTTVHCPLASRLSPEGWASSQVEAAAFRVLVAPLELVRVTSTLPTVAATNPAPSPASFWTVTVKVWGWPTSLVALWAMEILASTNVFTASPELGAMPSVERVRATPPTDRDTEACPVTCPAVIEVNTTVHCPLASRLSPEGWASSQVEAAAFRVLVAPLELVRVTSTLPTVAATNPAPSPASFWTGSVKVWGWPPSLVSPCAPYTTLFRSVFTASPELGAMPSVERVRATPPTDRD